VKVLPALVSAIILLLFFALFQRTSVLDELIQEQARKQPHSGELRKLIAL
jgi:heme exporter protein D